MHGLDLHKSSSARETVDPALEVERLEALLEERRAELSDLQEEFREFKLRYAGVVGGPLAELAEVEQEIRQAEARMLGHEDDAEEDEPSHFYDSSRARAPGKTGLRKLFWSVARMFHPDHASDEGEARRRHTIMAEASRAYRDGDVESLSTLLDDEQLQSYCASSSSSREDEPEEASARLLHLKEELVTIEFGIKRLRQDRLYHLMLSSAEDARQGRDHLAQMADAIRRKIVKARNRLAHLG
jgi:hypothetical protein